MYLDIERVMPIRVHDSVGKFLQRLDNGRFLTRHAGHHSW